MLTFSPPPPAVEHVTDNLKHVYCVHSSVNQVFTLTPKPERRSVVAFVNRQCADNLNKMVSMHVEFTREWPRIEHGEPLRLPSPKSWRETSTQHSWLQQHSLDELKLTCASNALDLLIVKAFDEDTLRADLIVMQPSEQLMRSVLETKV